MYDLYMRQPEVRYRNKKVRKDVRCPYMLTRIMGATLLPILRSSSASISRRQRRDDIIAVTAEDNQNIETLEM